MGKHSNFGGSNTPSETLPAPLRLSFSEIVFLSPFSIQKFLVPPPEKQIFSCFYIHSKQNADSNSREAFIEISKKVNKNRVSMVSGFNITVFFHTISTIEYPLSTSNVFTSVKGALSVLRQFLATESPLQMMKNVLYFTLKTLFTLKIFKFLS